MKPKQSEQGLAGGFAQRGEIIAFNGHFRIPNMHSLNGRSICETGRDRLRIDCEPGAGFVQP